MFEKLLYWTLRRNRKANSYYSRRLSRFLHLKPVEQIDNYGPVRDILSQEFFEPVKNIFFLR